jgi:hypothetical protein
MGSFLLTANSLAAATAESGKRLLKEGWETAHPASKGIANRRLRFEIMQPFLHAWWFG